MRIPDFNSKDSLDRVIVAEAEDLRENVEDALISRADELETLCQKDGEADLLISEVEGFRRGLSWSEYKNNYYRQFETAYGLDASEKLAKAGIVIIRHYGSGAYGLSRETDLKTIAWLAASKKQSRKELEKSVRMQQVERVISINDRSHENDDNGYTIRLSAKHVDFSDEQMLFFNKALQVGAFRGWIMERFGWSL